jgi:alkylhydroperoxidase/carboxymuconolactone decarboxylase family protein YurZ
MLTGGTFTVTWTCADNSTIDLTEQQLLGLAAALAAHSDALHQTARALKAAVDAALAAGATAEEIDALPVWEVS